MKQILIPTDFSKDSHKAYELGASLAKREGYGIHLYHIVHNHMFELSYWIYGAYLLSNFRKQSQEEIEKSSKLLKEHAMLPVFKDVSIETSLSESVETPAMQVVEEINKENYALVVIGSSSDTNEENNFSTVVAKYTKRPLIVVKEKETKMKMKNTLLCLDLDLHPEKFLNNLEHFSNDSITNHDILVVNTSANFRTNQEIEHDFKRLVSQYDLTNAQLKIYNANSKSEGIVQFANKWNYDNIAMLAKTDSTFRNLISDNPLEEVIKMCKQNLYIEHTDAKIPQENGYKLDYERPGIPTVGM